LEGFGRGALMPGCKKLACSSGFLTISPLGPFIFHRERRWKAVATYRRLQQVQQEDQPGPTTAATTTAAAGLQG